jgi:hypothetical protein
MNHKEIRSTDDLIKWLHENTMSGVDSVSYINKYLMETVDVLLERCVAPPRVKIDVQATYAEDQELVGYRATLSVWEGEQNFNAQFIYFPVMDGKIVSVLVTHRPGS